MPDARPAGEDPRRLKRSGADAEQGRVTLLALHRDRYFAALLEGDAVTAVAELGGLLEQGVPKPVAFAEVVAPCMHDVGDLWARAELSVAEEHMASAVARESLERVAEPARRTSPGAPSAVVAAAPGELHDLGARMVADCLAGAGWRVDYLGASVPAADLAAFARRRRAGVVALSLALPGQADGVREVARALDGPGRPRLVVGGGGVRALRADAAALGADELCDDLETFSLRAAPG